MCPTSPWSLPEGWGNRDKWTESAAAVSAEVLELRAVCRGDETTYVSFSVTWGVRGNPHSHFKPSW